MSLADARMLQCIQCNIGKFSHRDTISMAPIFFRHGADSNGKHFQMLLTDSVELVFCRYFSFLFHVECAHLFTLSIFYAIPMQSIRARFQCVLMSFGTVHALVQCFDDDSIHWSFQRWFFFQLANSQFRLNVRH